MISKAMRRCIDQITCSKGGQQVVASDGARDTSRKKNQSNVLRNVGLAIDESLSVRISHQLGTQIACQQPVSVILAVQECLKKPKTAPNKVPRTT